MSSAVTDLFFDLYRSAYLPLTACRRDGEQEQPCDPDIGLVNVAPTSRTSRFAMLALAIVVSAAHWVLQI